MVIDGLGRDDMPHWRGAIAGGIWQSVSLIATGPVYVDDTFVTSDIHTGEVGIASTFQNRGLRTQSATITWSITEYKSDTQVASGRETINLKPGTNHHKEIFTIANHKLWQLDDPNLYVVTTTVALESETSDIEKTRASASENLQLKARTST